jgi:2-isopropylmalate synthase
MQRNFSGMGADEDIVVASARAYVSALNKLISFLSASSSRGTARPASVTAASASADSADDATQGALVGAK